MAVVKGIKLLHKRYTLAEWDQNKAKLAFGEFGIATDTGEVRCNTSSTSEISYSQATPVSSPEIIFSGTGDYISDISYDSKSNATNAKGDVVGHALTITKSSLPEVVIDFEGNGDHIISAKKDGSHKIIFELGYMPTSTLKIIDGGDDTSVKEGDTSVEVITTLENTGGTNGESSGHDHEIKYKTTTVPTLKYVQELTQSVGVKVTPIGQGDFVKSISTADGRDIQVTFDNLPEIPQGTGEVTSTSSHTTASDATVVADVKLEGHTLSGHVKSIAGVKTTSGHGEIKVTTEAGKINIGLDDSNYALKSEMSMAMVFKGTLGTGGTATTLPSAAEDYVGDSYKVITKGTYAGLTCEPGDLVVCAKIGTSSYEWILIPAGDDVDDFINSIAQGVGIEVTAGVNPTISHKDLSEANTITADFQNSKYGYTGKLIAGLEFDTEGLGHVAKNPSMTETLNLVSVDGLDTKLGEVLIVTSVSGDDSKIAVENVSADAKNPNYKVSHTGSAATQNDETGSIASDRKISVVTAVDTDSTGHATKVTTKEFTLPEDNNTWRPVEITGENTTLSLAADDATALKLNTAATDGIKGVTLDVNASSKQVTIKTLGKATADENGYGFVKLGTGAVLSGQVYNVGVNANGGLAVAVPWTDTDQWDPVENDGEVGHKIVTPDSGLRFAAVQRDRGGHVIGIEDIYTIDGNALDDTPPDIVEGGGAVTA